MKTNENSEISYASIEIDGPKIRITYVMDTGENYYDRVDTVDFIEIIGGIHFEIEDVNFLLTETRILAAIEDIAAAAVLELLTEILGPERAAARIKLAHKFAVYLQTGAVHADIADYV